MVLGVDNAKNARHTGRPNADRPQPKPGAWPAPGAALGSGRPLPDGRGSEFRFRNSRDVLRPASRFRNATQILGLAATLVAVSAFGAQQPTSITLIL